MERDGHDGYGLRQPKNDVGLCETCKGMGQVPKAKGPIKYLRLWNPPQEMEECPICKGSGIKEKV